MVHAGLLPSWTVAQALALSREVEAMLASDRAHEFLGVLYGDEPRRWSDDLDGLRPPARRSSTRARGCASARADDTMELTEKRGPAQHARRASRRGSSIRRGARRASTVVCGHWSTLELMLAPNVLMLDSGCLWGGTLTAVRLPDRRVYQVPSRAPVQPKPFG